MQPKLNFFDRLMGRKTKTVVEKDKNGRVTEQVEYTFDKFGGVVSQSVRRPDEQTGVLRKYKDKTYVRRKDGSYDPLRTTYYDSSEREIISNRYERDSSGMLFCDREKFAYSKSGVQLLTKYSKNRYDGGLWTRLRETVRTHDSFGQLIRKEDFQQNPETGKLICTKDKSYARQPDGTYDPKETSYFDMLGRVVKSKVYHREKTEMGDEPMLVGEKTEYSYKEDGTKIATQPEKSVFINDIVGWMPLKAVEAAGQAQKQDRIVQVEAENRLKGTDQKPALPQTSPRKNDGR